MWGWVESLFGIDKLRAVELQKQEAAESHAKSSRRVQAAALIGKRRSSHARAKLVLMTGDTEEVLSRMNAVVGIVRGRDAGKAPKE